MDVQIEPLENTVWNTRRFALDLQFLLYRWYQDYPDPHNEYYQVWALHNPGQARQSWKDEMFDTLCTLAAAETDPQKRLSLYYQAETRLQTQFAYMPIHWRVDNYAIQTWVQNVPKNKQGYVVMNTNIFDRLWDSAYISEDSSNAPPT